MEEENKLPTILKCPASYELMGNDDQEIAQGGSDLVLDAEKLTVLPESGDPLLIPYRDIIQISRGGYKINVDLVSKEKLIVSNLGYKFEDFFRNFSNLNNEVILKDLLMNEPIHKSGVAADLVYADKDKTVKALGQCELRIYETGAVIIGGDGNFIRIPYSDLAQIRIDNYKLILDTDYGDSYAFSRMGKELDECFKMLNDLINALSIKTQFSLKELLPIYDSSVVRKIAKLMKDGRAAKRFDIEAISPGIWTELEKKLDSFGIKEQYEYLQSIGQAERTCIGIKRGLMGDLTGEYLWFLVPIFSRDSTCPGNAIAMEATTNDGSNRATYFFRITDLNTYLNFKSLEELQVAVDETLKMITRDLINVNFRREPIYLTSEQLNSTAYVGYLRTIAKVASLRELRRLFIGRVMHYTPEQWSGDVMQLLKSNLRPA
ncbi:MAG: hypothetical protein WAU62_01210 [Dehalococcoidales bacterium]|jgi:hypothetical protein